MCVIHKIGYSNDISVRMYVCVEGGCTATYAIQTGTAYIKSISIMHSVSMWTADEQKNWRTLTQETMSSALR